MTKKIIAAVIAFVIIFSAIGCEAQSASGGGTTANGEATSFTPTVAPNTSAPDLTIEPTEETTVPNVETTVPDVTTATPETTLTPDTTTAPIEETTVPDETTAPDVTTEETTAPDITTAPDVTTSTPETTITPETTLTPETTAPTEDTTEAPHVHTPETVKGTAATCTKDGLTDGVRCATCKTTLTAQTKIEAKGHSYTVTKEPNLDPYSADFAADGEKTCTGCGKTAAVRAQAPAIDSEEYARLLANRLLYYINLIRVEEGNLPAQMLPNMTALAEYRAVQLSTNFAHDSSDISAAATALKYGQYNYTEITHIDPETWEVIHTGEYREYYAPCCGEAIGKCTHYVSRYGNDISYLDKRAAETAQGYHESEGHWAYVGRDENVFISIGYYVDIQNEWAYSCICTSPSDIYG